MSDPKQLVQKLWNYCNILRDDGLSYGDYVEQLTLLLLFNMADEQSRPLFNKPNAVPKESAWPSLLARVGRRFIVAADLESVVSARMEQSGQFAGCSTWMTSGPGLNGEKQRQCRACAPQSLRAK